MNKAKRYYVDKNGNMVGYPRYCCDKTEMPAETFHAKLKIVGICWLNSGCYFTLQDENGKTYSMNDIMLRQYFSQNDMYLEGDWHFYQQGSSFSIGL